MTFYISALEILLLTYLLTPDLAAFQIFGLAFSLYSIIQLIRVSIDKPTTLGYRKVISCAFLRHDVHNKTFPLSCWIAFLLYMWAILTDGLCVFAVIITKACSAQIVGRNTALMWGRHVDWVRFAFLLLRISISYPSRLFQSCIFQPCDLLPIFPLLLFPLLHFQRPLEYCVPVWHYAVIEEQTQQLETIQKQAIHIISNFTRRMPYSLVYGQKTTGQKPPDKRPPKMPTPDKRPHGQKTTRTKDHHRRNFVVHFGFIMNFLRRKNGEKFQ